MKVRQHLTYANVAATLALVGVVGGGGAYAAGLIDSGDIKNNSIRSKDLRNRTAVKARDVQRNGLTGKEINERTLSAKQFAPLKGATDSCDPGSELMNCVGTRVLMRNAGRLMIIATGDYFGDGSSAGLECRISVNGSSESGASFPGEEGDGSTTALATDGFARTLVTSRLPRGRHEVRLECSETQADAALASATIAVLGISG